MSTIAEQLENVSLKLKANIYFDGGVVSHAITAPGQKRRTVGLIRPGEYHFTTEAPEQMDIIAGTCRVKFKGETTWKTFKSGETFHVAAQSAFDIAVDAGLAEYLCTFG